MIVWPGDPYPLGATVDGGGCNFSLYSEVAERIELCLFDDQGNETRVELPESSGYCWHGYVPGIRAGQLYGYRVHGPWAPGEGHRCNPAKLLIDPYARAIAGDVKWGPALFPYNLGDPDGPLNGEDSAPSMPKSVIVSRDYDRRGERHLLVPWEDTVIYELHVKGFTARHPDIPPEIRGTYAGLAHPAAIEHLRRMGVTTVELMPVHQFVHEPHLLERGLRNYWGYNSIGYFAPHAEYSSTGDRGQQVHEFRYLVRTLHNAGFEVILDVVYNHTAEGNHLGPMLAFRGIDNQAYYRLVEKDRRYYMDYTGTGNSLNMRNPYVLQLLMDSLRYWVTEMNVDGFRFDLAATLARELHDVDRLSAFFDVIQQDPVTSRVKLIAEPWDVGEGGYQVGNFPPLWSEWNGKYRDSVRDYWRGEESRLGELANRFTGSSDLYQADGRRPHASVNFVTAHDGFTLEDLVSYNEKHNQANGEENRDGESHNRSWNCGVEGPTDDPAILALRGQMKRSLLATLLLSQGIPMLVAGDELGRTQGGNNNAYCQDNEVSWMDWEHADGRLLEFTQRLIELRRTHGMFRRRGWFQGKPIHGSGVDDIAWFNPDGSPMEDEHWDQSFARSLMVFLNGKSLRPGRRGEPRADWSFLVLFNAHHDDLAFTLPTGPWGELWSPILDTRYPPVAAQARLKAGQAIELAGRSMALLARED